MNYWKPIQEVKKEKESSNNTTSYEEDLCGLAPKAVGTGYGNDGGEASKTNIDHGGI